MIMVTYVIGDIHGNFLGLEDVLKKCNFKKSDTLISLGDFCDGGCRTREVIDRLLKIPKLINILGNHDSWAGHWMKTGIELPVWWHQGGMATASSYGFDYKSVPQSHIKFITEALLYYIDDQNRVFVHGGFDPFRPVPEQSIDVLTWDRDLLCSYAPHNIIKGYKHVFVGHTTTQHFGRDYKVENCLVPLTFNNLTAMDTGAGWDGRLSVMDVDTFEFWQSEISANQQNMLKKLEDLKFGSFS
jgi:serine/threonine protein phosphatase 1